MAAQADIVLNDGQATPVARTFSVRGATFDKALWKNISSGINVGMPEITIGVKETSGPQGKVVVDARIKVPAMEVISGSDGGYTPSPKEAYSCWGVASFTLPNRSQLADRKDILAFLQNLFANTQLRNAVLNYERPT